MDEDSIVENKKSKAFALLCFAVIPLGLEPKTYCLEGSCSIQLSYGTIKSGCKINVFFVGFQIIFELFVINPNQSKPCGVNLYGVNQSERGEKCIRNSG